MTTRTDPAQVAAVRDYRRWAAELMQHAEQMRREGKPITADEALMAAQVARKAANREAHPEAGRE